MGRTRLLKNRKKALRVIKKNLDSIAKLINNSKSPNNVFDLRSQQDRLSSWRESTREQLLDLFDDESEVRIGAPKGIYTPTGGTLQDEANRIFGDLWDERSELIRLRAKIQHMPIVPWYERLSLFIKGIPGLFFLRYLNRMIILGIIFIIVILLAIWKPDIVAFVVEKFERFRGR